MPVYAGIDIGNGGIKAALCDASGRPETIRSERGGKSWPSCVYLPPTGETVLGEDAREQGLVTPSLVAKGWKGKLADEKKLYFDRTMTASDVVGLAVKKVVEQIQKQTGQKIDGVVVTWPANFKDDMKNGLLKGFKVAGVKVVQGITEPGAAAYAYCCKKRVILLICVDVGHGTVDVSVMEVKDGVAVPVATEGIPKLGGRDFTAAVMRILLEKASRTTGKTIKRENLAPEQIADLQAKAEKAKHALGGLPSTKVALNFAGKPLLIEISRDEYEQATKGLVKQILACVDKTIAAAKKIWNDFEMLVLAGAPNQSVRLQEMIADHTGLVPKVEIDPATVVAQGAALHAHNLAVAEGTGKVIPNRPLLQEATGHDVGVAVEDETKDSRPLVCDVVVPKNTPVPAELPEKVYRLPSESSTEAFIEIVQGPHNAPIEKCIKIGVIHLKGLPREPLRTYRIEVVFKFDSNALCEVTARDKISGSSQTVSVKLTNRNAKGGSR